MGLYGFKDRTVAERAAKYFRQNEKSNYSLYPEAEFPPARVRLVQLTADTDGHGDPEDAGAFQVADTEIICTSADPQKLLSADDGGFVTIQEAAPLEPTNFPVSARVMAVTDTFNQTFFFQPTPSEVFGEVQDGWAGADYDTAVEVTLDAGFTVNGQDKLQAYPAPMLQEALPGSTKVTCRYVKAVGRWFFFRPSTSGSIEISVWGDPLNIHHSATGKTVFYTEIAAGESVASADPLLLIAAPVSVPVAGAASGAWVDFFTDLETPDEEPGYWNKSGPLYQYVSGGKYRIAPVKFYGKVISDGNGRYYMPRYRTINGQRYWESDDAPRDYIYRTKKDDVSGWAIGFYLGKYLTENDQETFVSDADAQTGGFEDALAALMDQESLTYGKPEWVSDDPYGLYSPNSEMQNYNPDAEDVQFGCEYWEAPSWTDEDEQEHEFAFTHVCDGSVKKLIGYYECQAFHVVFKNIRRLESWEDAGAGYFLGDPNSTKGYYVSGPPDTSEDWDFEYRPGDHGLRCELTFESVDENHVETWTMKYDGEVAATYTRQEGGTFLTYQTPGQDEQDDAHENYVFRNISRSPRDWTYVWIAEGVDGTVGTLEFHGAELSMTGKNIFVFHHQIALTFEGYERSFEHATVYMVSPGIIS